MALPPPDIALNVPVEELAGYLVTHHKSMPTFNIHNTMCEVDGQRKYHDRPQMDDKTRALYKDALVEAYSWAFTEGLFIFDPSNINGNWWKVSRRGQLIDMPIDVLKLAAREMLPKAFLHPLIAEHATAIFHSGKYDAAVFQAFKQVEIYVREASNLQLDGAALMKSAFNVKSGVLNHATDPSEREGLMFVFAGATQLFRNASGHRDLDLEPQEAAHLLIHASYLMNLVDKYAALAKAAPKVGASAP